MKFCTFFFPRPHWAFQFVLVFFWALALQETDAYYSVYLLCALLSALCLVLNHRTPPSPLSSRNQKLLILFGGLFSAATFAANWPLFLVYNLLDLFRCVFTLWGGTVVGYHILLAAYHYCPAGETKTPTTKTAVRLFIFTFLSCALIDILYLLFGAYPGILTPDSITTMKQIYSGIYNNTMPFWHTMLVSVFFRLGLLVFGEANAAIAFFHFIQILFMAGCFACALTTLYQSGAPRWFLIAVFCIYVFLPYNISYSITLWKDVPFSASALLLVTSFYRILRSVGNKTQNYSVFILGALGLCLLRTNGLLAFGVTTLVLGLILRKQQPKLIILMATLVILCWVLIGPVLSFLGVTSTDLVEALAVPFQQISRVIYMGHPLSAEDTALLSQAFDLEIVRQRYNPGSVDPVKFYAFKRDNLPIIQEQLPDYLRLYIRLGLEHPRTYLAAWIEETKGYWNAGYKYWIHTYGIEPNDLGLAFAANDSFISHVFISMFDILKAPGIFQCLYSIGLQVWLIIGCCLVNALKKRSEALLCVPLIVLAVGLWLGSPVYTEFRYAYPFFLTAPVILGVTLLCPEKHS